MQCTDSLLMVLFNTLSGLVIAFLPRSKCLLVSCLQSTSALILESPKIKSVTVSIVSPFMCHEVMGPDSMIFVFLMLSFKPAFSFSSFTFIKRLFSSSLLSAIRMVSSAYLTLLVFLLAILILACASSSLAFHMMYSAYIVCLQCGRSGLVKSLGEGDGNPPQFSCLENPMDRGALWATV